MRAPTPSAALAALLAAACGDGLELPVPPQVAAPARVSGGASPLAPGCNAATQPGRRYAASEVEPHLAIHPVNPDHLVAAWQQERWSNGGADGIVAGVSLDGGRTWTRSLVPFSRCGGGTPAGGGGYERASDPWVTFSSDGAVVHQIALAFDPAPARRDAILVSRSRDGGLTWSEPQALAAETDPDAALDKPSITADPVRPGAVYAVWDRLTGLSGADPAAARGPAWFARTLDGGVTWEEPRPIYDPGPDAQTIANQIVVLPDGTLVDVLARIAAASTAAPVVDVVALRSADGGTSWGEPVRVAALDVARAVDGSGHPVRAGELVPSAAVDAEAGTLHVAWQDGRFGGVGSVGIAVATSADGGATWTPPAQVNAAPSVQAFLPAIAARDGRVAVTYYDLRHDGQEDPARLWATVWRVSSTDGGASWVEVPEGGPFDLRSAPDAGGWFVGDYTGLVARRDGFTALFAMAGEDPADVFASGAPVPSAIAAGPAAGAAPAVRGGPPRARERGPAIMIRR